MERRGPVEFNHAISYVNKIKVSIYLRGVYINVYINRRLIYHLYRIVSRISLRSINSSSKSYRLIKENKNRYRTSMLK